MELNNPRGPRKSPNRTDIIIIIIIIHRYPVTFYTPTLRDLNIIIQNSYSLVALWWLSAVFKQARKSPQKVERDFSVWAKNVSINILFMTTFFFFMYNMLYTYQRKKLQYVMQN